MYRGGGCSKQNVSSTSTTIAIYSIYIPPTETRANESAAAVPGMAKLVSLISLPISVESNVRGNSTPTRLIMKNNNITRNKYRPSKYRDQTPEGSGIKKRNLLYSLQSLMERKKDNGHVVIFQS